MLRSSVMAGYPTKYEFPVYIETAERLDEIVISVNLKPREAKIIEYKIEEPHKIKYWRPGFDNLHRRDMDI